MDVWVIDLEPSPFEGVFWDVLDAQEKDRASRFYFDEHRRRFIIAHAATRFILASYLGIAAADVRFELNSYGKPSLRSASTPVFSLSHSHEKALFAVAGDGEIGVDIEWSRNLRHVDLAERYFSAIERDALDQLAADKKIEGFFSCWTRKEAYIKAKGLGLSIPLNAFSVEASPDLPAALIESRYVPDDAERFQIWDLPVIAGYTAALAYLGDAIGPPHCCHWVAPC